MQALKNVISAVNVYIQQVKSRKGVANGQLLKSIARYITSILRVFGVIESSELTSFGWSSGPQNGQVVNEEEIILPFLDVLSEFREKVRSTARSIDNPAIKSAILKECDLIRDEKLPNLGVRLEDHEGSPTVIKYVGKEVMMREKELREKLEKEREAEKLRK
jgi:cysteinyl-tRNA synthetase